MPRIPRYVQQSLNAGGVPSTAGVDATAINQTNQIFQTLGRVNNAYMAFEAKQFTAAKSIEMEAVLAKQRDDYRRANQSNPGDDDSFTKYLDTAAKTIKSYEDAAPNGIARSNISGLGQQLMTREAKGMETWRRTQRATNALNDNGRQLNTVASQVRLGNKSWQDGIADLTSVFNAQKGSVNDQKNQEFFDTHQANIKFNAGLTAIEADPLAADSLLKDSEYVKGLSANQISRLKNLSNSRKDTNQKKALADTVKFQNDPVRWEIDNGRRQVINFQTMPPEQITAELQRRIDDQVMRDPKGIQPLMHSGANLELDQVVSMIRNSPSNDAKIAFMQQADTIIPEAAKKRVADQLYKKDPVLGGALVYATEQPDVSRALLSGQKLIQNAAIDNTEIREFNNDFDDYFDNVSMSPDLAGQVKPLAKAMFAFNLKNAKDRSGQSIDKAIGALIGEKTQVRDSVVFPFRLPNGQFATAAEAEFVLDNITQEELDRNAVAPFTRSGEPVKIEDIRDKMQLRTVGQDTYNIIVDGGALYNVNTSKPIVFDFATISQTLARNFAPTEPSSTNTGVKQFFKKAIKAIEVTP